MTPRSTGRFRVQGRSAPDSAATLSEQSGISARVLPLGGHASLALDADAVRRRVGAWAALQPAGARADVDRLWREGLLVGDQVVARARATLGASSEPVWAIDVPLPSDGHALAAQAAVSPRLVSRAVETLIAAEVLDGVRQVGTERVVRVRPEVLADAPVLAAVQWDVVRARLGAQDAAVARLIVRELARRTSPEARAAAHFVAASQRELADAVGYSKGSMRRHLDALVDAGLLVSRARDRANSWHRLQAIVFDGEGFVGQADTGHGASVSGTAVPALPPRADEGLRSRRAPSPNRGVSRALPSPALTPDIPGADRPRDVAGSTAPQTADTRFANTRSADTRSDGTGTADARTVDAALTLEVNGVRVALPPGVELTLEQDATGALWYRAGALRLGPVRFG